MLIGIYLVILLATFAMLFRDGLWSNLISLFNVVMAALLATNFFEPLASWFTSLFPTATYFWDFLALWLCFIGFYVLLRIPTQLISTTQVKLPTMLDAGGSAVVALFIGWVFICFTGMTLHTAPLARDSMAGGLRPEKPSFFGTYPDRLWLSFVHGVTGGNGNSRLGNGRRVFDPQAEFLPKYASRRENFSKQRQLLVPPGELGLPSGS